MSTGPPRFVPTLTEVVETTPLPAQGVDDASQTITPTGESTPDRTALENQLVHRVLQRVDLILERKLREAVGQVILEHTEQLAPQLRVEIEWVVRQSVSQALAQEVSNIPS